MSRSRESGWLAATCQLRSDTGTHIDALVDCLALQQHYGHIRRVG
jgi:kynurenine formamidase